MHLKKTALLAAATASIIASGALAAPAVAAPATCGIGAGCTWTEAGYQGSAPWFNGGKLHFQYNIRNYEDYFVVPGLDMNDRVSSVYNNGRTGLDTLFWSDANFRGAVERVKAGTGISNLTTVGLNDKISSACFVNYCK